MVWVGPPLLPSGARSRSVRLVKTMLPSTPLTSPPEPPVPIRLLLPETCDTGDVAGAEGIGVAGDDGVGQGGRAGRQLYSRRRCAR